MGSLNANLVLELEVNALLKQCEDKLAAAAEPNHATARMLKGVRHLMRQQSDAVSDPEVRKEFEASQAPPEPEPAELPDDAPPLDPPPQE